MKRPRIVVAGAALALGVGLLAGAQTLAQSRGTIKIASQTPLSGPQSNLGEAIRLGAQLAVRDFGAAITRLGFQLTYQPEDDQATANVGVANANRLINDPDILAVVGHLNSGVALPSGEVYHRVGLASVSPANTAVTLTERGYAEFNRIAGRDDVQGPAGAQYLYNTAKARRVFVINDLTAYGQGVANAFAAEFRRLGGQVLENAGVENTVTDFSAILTRAGALRPDAVYFGGIYNQGGPLLRQMRERGITAIFAGADGLDSSELERLAGTPNVKGVIYTTTAVPLSQFTSGATFASRYKAAFNREPEGYSAYGYDAMRVAIQGIASAIRANGGNKPSRAQVAKAIRATRITGLTGNIRFNAKGDLTSARYVVLKIDNAFPGRIASVLNVPAP